MNQNISDSLISFPEFLSSKDLVRLGIYNSVEATYQARLHGNSPGYIKLRKKILYPKQLVVEFLENRMRPGVPLASLSKQMEG